MDGHISVTPFTSRGQNLSKKHAKKKTITQQNPKKHKTPLLHTVPLFPQEDVIDICNEKNEGKKLELLIVEPLSCAALVSGFSVCRTCDCSAVDDIAH